TTNPPRNTSTDQLSTHRISFSRSPATERRLRNHSAIKHLVGNRTCHFLDKQLANLRVALQKLNCLLFLRRWWLFVRFLLPQLLAGGALVFLNDLVGHLVQYRVLILSVCSTTKSQHQGRDQQTNHLDIY